MAKPSKKIKVEEKVVCDVCHGAGQDPEGVSCLNCERKEYFYDKRNDKVYM